MNINEFIYCCYIAKLINLSYAIIFFTGLINCALVALRFLIVSSGARSGRFMGWGEVLYYACFVLLYLVGLFFVLDVDFSCFFLDAGRAGCFS